LATIDPGDIERIEILKGLAAAAPCKTNGCAAVVIVALKGEARPSPSR
jgi:hypothetical protein